MVDRPSSYQGIVSLKSLLYKKTGKFESINQTVSHGEPEPIHPEMIQETKDLVRLVLSKNLWEEGRTLANTSWCVAKRFTCNRY